MLVRIIIILYVQVTYVATCRYQDNLIITQIVTLVIKLSDV